MNPAIFLEERVTDDYRTILCVAVATRHAVEQKPVTEEYLLAFSKAIDDILMGLAKKHLSDGDSNDDKNRLVVDLYQIATDLLTGKRSL